MAINQTPISRSIALPTQTVSSGTGLTQLASATSAVSQLLTERINDVAIGQAAIEGEQDVQNERQPTSLAYPFTKATKAYNDAVSNTEARRMVASAEELINESLANSKNPATFTRDTPAKFKAEIDGIKSGILQHTRDENREHIREALDKLTAHASLNMLQHSIEFDNKQTNLDMQQDITRLLEVAKNASIAGDTERLSGAYAAIDSSLADYSTMNAGIKRIEPYLRADIEKHKQINAVLGGYSEALHNKTTPKFLADLADNKEKLPYNIWQDSVKAVVALDQTEKRLKNDINAQQVAQVDLGIEKGTIQDASDLLNYTELTVPQTLTAIKNLDKHQAKLMKEGSDLITAQQNILRNTPTWNSADTKNKMFKAQIQAMEAQTGRPATLADMEQSVLGQGQFPASGMPDTPMGTNVPAFDGTISQHLTGKDPVMTAQAAMVYNDMVNTKNSPNSINITGDALAVANLFNELLTGGTTTPEMAAEQAINKVLNASEPEVAARTERYHKTLEKIDPRTGKNKLMLKFKDAFGVDSQTFGADQAFKLFSDTYRANFLASNSEEGAFNATKYEMRSYGTSKYFDKGFVGQPVPEKDVPITNVGNAFPNQIVSNLQGFINRNNAARAAHPELNIPLVEWADPKQTINFTESEQDKVFKKMTIGNRPRLKINGHETDVVLMPSATSRLDNSVNYLLGVYDQFNNLNPLRDPTNTVDQVARFRPQELSTWAPALATKQTDDALRNVALKVRQQETQTDVEELKALEKKTPLWQVVFGFERGDEYLQYIANRNAKTDDGRLEQIIDSLKGKTGAAVTRDAITDADNVGISQSLVPSAPEFINAESEDIKTAQETPVYSDESMSSYIAPATTKVDKPLSEEAISSRQKARPTARAVRDIDYNDYQSSIPSIYSQASTKSSTTSEKGERSIVPNLSDFKFTKSEGNLKQVFTDKEIDHLTEAAMDKKSKEALDDIASSALALMNSVKDKVGDDVKRGVITALSMLYPSPTPSEKTEALKLVNTGFENYDQSSMFSKTMKRLEKDNEYFDKQHRDTFLSAHRKMPLLMKTIEDIHEMKGDSSSKQNLPIRKQVMALYPQLSEKESKLVIDNLYLVLNKQKPNSGAS
jgi:hypothetical protein